MRTPFFRRFLIAWFVLLLAAVAPPAAFAAIIWNKVYAGFSSPLGVTNAHDGSQRLFVVQQSGAIRIVKNGAVLAVPFLDLGGPSGVTAQSGEQGLLGTCVSSAVRNQPAVLRQLHAPQRRRNRHRPLRSEHGRLRPSGSIVRRRAADHCPT